MRSVDQCSEDALRFGLVQAESLAGELDDLLEKLTLTDTPLRACLPRWR